ncbi:MAG: YhcH/YjgK/YiaL family protein [Bacteroidales bacterium]|nr:YhcH/YjgK/YiaL family protein [Bacteroidales bacterium]MBN2818809.1 YhcH/YjgK/YiaL family protein [Bacteroidales bacterium]
MVIDKFENYKLYSNLSDKISRAFDFIMENDFNTMQPGKYFIDNEEIYAMVQEYDTKDLADCKLEGHYKYIDIQYMIKGSENIGVASLKNQVPTEKNEDKDYVFYVGDTSIIRVDEGMFTIFFPDDLHMPGMKAEKSSKVKKLVIKIKV